MSGYLNSRHQPQPVADTACPSSRANTPQISVMPRMSNTAPGMRSRSRMKAKTKPMIAAAANSFTMSLLAGRPAFHSTKGTINSVKKRIASRRNPHSRVHSAVRRFRRRSTLAASSCWEW